MIIDKNGRTFSRRTRAEEDEYIQKELAALDPDELAALELMLKEMETKGLDGSSVFDLLQAAEYSTPPVDIETFVMDEYFLGNTCAGLYPRLKADLKDLFSGGYQEAIFTGSIGWGKTFAASIGICRILYELSCMKDPQRSLGLAPGSNISLVCLSVNETLAMKVAFENIATKIKASPYFDKHFPFKETKKEFRFPKSVWLAARATTDTSVLGLNCLGGILDECVHADSKILLCDGTEERAETVFEACQHLLGEPFLLRTFDFAAGCTVEAPAYIKRSADQECFELGLNNGMQLRASWKHPVAVLRGGQLRFIWMSDIFVGDEVFVHASLDRRAQEKTFGSDEGAVRSGSICPSAGLDSSLGVAGSGAAGERLEGEQFRVREAGHPVSMAGQEAMDAARPRGLAGQTDGDHRGETKGLYLQCQGEGEDDGRSEALRGARLGLRGVGRETALAVVVSKRSLGVQPTYDVCVPGYEVFVADGVVVHNTNFMRKDFKPDPRFGHIDHAEVLYTGMKRRMKSRFEKRGRLPGMLFLVSSKKTRDDFTARRIRDSRNDPTVFVRDYALWDVKPDDSYSEQKFLVLCGNENTPSKILDEGEAERFLAAKKAGTLPDGITLVEVPEDFRFDFESDLEGAIRDIAGVATVAIRPFIQRREKLVATAGMHHPFSVEVYDPSKSGFFMWDRMVQKTQYKDFSGYTHEGLRPIVNPETPRHVHIDPSYRKDSTGLCVAHIAGWRDVLRRNDDGDVYQERAPVFYVDLILRIVPPVGDEIVLGDIRRLVYELSQHGYMITYVSLDTWQSVDALQQLKQKGYRAEHLSVDTKPDPYEHLKTAFYEDRVKVYPYEPLFKELLQLERDETKKKIDHPPKGCFTGDTRVALLDGTLPTFEELARRFAPGEKFPVYSIGPEGVCVGWGHDARRTKTVTSLIEVMLDNYQVIECTPDHLFMTLDGDWIQAQYLSPDVRLMPLYRSREGKGGWFGYERLWCPKRRRRLLTHQLVAQQIFGALLGRHVHHKNGIKHDNRPENLELLAQVENFRKHLLSRHSDLAYVAALRAGHARYRENGGNEKNRSNIERLFAEGKLKRGRDVCGVEGCCSPTSAKGLCDLHYQRMRREQRRAMRVSRQQNHRVLSINVLQKTAEVWDLTVDDLENFALASGVFVHNSKDVADALAGCLYTLTQRSASQPLPVLRGMSYAPDIWMEEHLHASAAGSAGAPVDERFFPQLPHGGRLPAGQLPPFLGGGRGTGEMVPRDPDWEKGGGGGWRPL